MGEDKPTRGLTLAQKLDQLFKSVLSPDGNEYTYREVTEGINKMGETKISPAVIWRLRTGEHDDPKKSQLEAIAKFFEVPLEYFYGEGAAVDEIHAELKLLEKMREAGVYGIAARAMDLSATSKNAIANLVEQLREIEQHRDSGQDRKPGSEETD